MDDKDVQLLAISVNIFDNLQFDVGLRCAHEVVPDEQKNLLPHKDQIIEKLQFERDCVYSMGAKYRDEKRIEGFLS